MVLNVVYDLFYVAVSVVGSAGGSVFFYKRLFSEVVNGKLLGGKSLKDVSTYSETRLVSFYTFNNFSNYEYFRVTLSGLVSGNRPYALSQLIRHFRNFVIKRTSYLSLLRHFFSFNGADMQVIETVKLTANVALQHFFRLCTADISRSSYFGDSFYKLLFSVRHTRTFYLGFSESEIFYSPSQGILPLVRAGVSRMQYNFFFLYSFLERKTNIGFFRKLGGASGSNSLRFTSGLKKFDSSFFNNISANMLFGFSELSELGLSGEGKTVVLSKQFDVSKFFFLDEFSNSSFFNNLSGDLVFRNFSLLEDFTRISCVSNRVCC